MIDGHRCEDCKHFYEERGKFAPMKECGCWECEFESKEKGNEDD